MLKFSEIFKRLRTSYGYTQEIIAQKLDVSKSTVAMWETEKRMPSFEKLEEIADFFNVDMNTLLGNSNDIKEYYRIDSEEQEIIAQLRKLDVKKRALLLAYLKVLNEEV